MRAPRVARVTPPASRLPVCPWWHRHTLLLLLILTAVLYLPGSAVLPLMDRDEPRFAHATVEMMDRGTWLIPYFNDEYRFDKPPLTYWWMRMHYRLFGVNEFAARLHSVVAVFLNAWLLVCTARRWFGRRAGWIAGLSWVTTFQVLIHGRLCVADMPLVLAVTLSCRAMMELLMPPNEDPLPKRFGRWYWILWISIAAGFLAKGPLAWLVPVLAAALWRWVLHRKPVTWGRLQPLSGSLLALGLAGAWGIPALLSTDGAFWDVGMGEHVVKRGTDVFNGRKFIPGFYVLTSLFSLFPWIGFVVPAWKRMRREWSPVVAFLAAWVAAPHLIFFAYATQLPHYVMPGFPAVSLLLGCVWASEPRGALPRLFWGIAGGVSFFAAILVGVSVTDWVTVPDVRAVMSALGWLALTIFGGTAVALRVAVRRPWAGACIALILLGGFACELRHAAGVFRDTSATLRITGALHLDPTDAREPMLLAWEYAEPSLVFYTDAFWKYTGGNLSSAEAAATSGEPLDAIVLLRREWTLDASLKAFLAGDAPVPRKDFSADVDALRRRLGGWETKSLTGINIARASWVEVLVMQPHRP